MIDYHCHVDLYTNPLRVATEIAEKRIDVLAVTTSPRAYSKAVQYFKETKSLRIALGFHPELVSSRQHEWALFQQYSNGTRFIGEIGIDGSKCFSDSLDIQREWFENTIIYLEHHSKKIISVHSRNAVKLVLSILEKHLSKSRVILHWFTGNIKEAEWALELGCWFSINPKMCLSAKGRKIISVLPRDRILPETDGPFSIKSGSPYYPWDTTVSEYLSEIYNLSSAGVDNLLNGNLLGLENCK